MTQGNDLFAGMAICPSCKLEHRIEDRIEWNFPWGLRLSRCPRCLESDIDLPEVDAINETTASRRGITAGSFHHD